jgi:hypothetical protein
VTDQERAEYAARRKDERAQAAYKWAHLPDGTPLTATGNEYVNRENKSGWSDAVDPTGQVWRMSWDWLGLKEWERIG